MSATIQVGRAGGIGSDPAGCTSMPALEGGARTAPKVAMTVSRAAMAAMSLPMGREFSFRAVPTTIPAASPCVLSPGTTVLNNQAMLSLAEISDRLEIQQLLVDYSTAIDQRRFDDLDKVFTPDAYIEV